jgi:hypothetical protein
MDRPSPSAGGTSMTSSHEAEHPDAVALNPQPIPSG